MNRIQFKQSTITREVRKVSDASRDGFKIITRSSRNGIERETTACYE